MNTNTGWNRLEHAETRRSKFTPSLKYDILLHHETVFHLRSSQPRDNRRIVARRQAVTADDRRSARVEFVRPAPTSHPAPGASHRWRPEDPGNSGNDLQRTISISVEWRSVGVRVYRRRSTDKEDGPAVGEARRRQAGLPPSPPYLLRPVLSPKRHKAGQIIRREVAWLSRVVPIRRIQLGALRIWWAQRHPEQCRPGRRELGGRQPTRRTPDPCATLRHHCGIPLAV